MNDKTCITCGLAKPIEQFRLDERNSTHKDKRSSYCDDCRKAYAHEYGAKRRGLSSKLIDAEKEGRPCLDCGMLWPAAALDFDHIDRAKIIELSRGRKYTLQLIMAELDKCELVCSNCHRIRTWNRHRAHVNKQIINPYLLQPRLL